MSLRFVIAFTLLMPALAPGQWQYVQQNDELHAQIRDRFVLDGTYLSRPSVPSQTSAPTLVVICVGGKVTESYFNFGAVIDSDTRRLFPVMMESRIDGKKGTIGGNQISTDGQAVYFPRVELKKIRFLSRICGVIRVPGVVPSCDTGRFPWRRRCESRRIVW